MISTPSPSPLLSYAAGLGSLDPKLHIFDSPDTVLKFWFGPYSSVGDLNSIPYIDSMMGVWFAGKSPQFDQVGSVGYTFVVEKVTAIPF